MFTATMENIRSIKTQTTRSTLPERRDTVASVSTMRVRHSETTRRWMSGNTNKLYVDVNPRNELRIQPRQELRNLEGRIRE